MRTMLILVAALLVINSVAAVDSCGADEDLPRLAPATPTPTPEMTDGELIAQVQLFLSEISCLTKTQVRFDMNNPSITHQEGYWLVEAKKIRPDLPLPDQRWEVFESGLVRSLNDRGC